MITVAKRNLKRVAIVDDDETIRETYAESLDDLGVESAPMMGPLDLECSVQTILASCQALVTDLVLRKSGYSAFDGGALAAACRRKGIPAIICTSYTNVYQQLGRRDLRWISAILPQAQFEHPAIIKAFEKSIHEIDDSYSPDRRPWRTQIQVVDVAEDERSFYVTVMGRSPLEKVAVHFDDVPPSIQALITAKPILHALVNTGAKRAEELYFDEWEPR